MVSVSVDACDFGLARGLFRFGLGLAWHGADPQWDDCSGDCGVSRVWFVVLGLARRRALG